MSDKVIVQKGRTNSITVNMGVNVTGDTFKSEVRTEPDQASVLIATWTIQVTNASIGTLKLTMDDTVTAKIAYNAGYMDLKRTTGGEPVSVFDKPLEVEFRGTVTV